MILAPPIWKSCKEQIACLISFEHLIDTDALSKVEFCKILNSLRKYKKPENIKIFANSNSFLFVVDYMILATCQSSFLKAETDFGSQTAATASPAVSTLTMNKNESGKTGNESPSYEAPPIVDTEDENEENDDSNSRTDKNTTLIRGSSVTSRIKLDISKYHSEQNLDQCISLFANALTSPDAHQTLVKHLNKDQKIDFLSAIHSILLKGPNANMQHRAVRFLANLAFTQDLFLVFSNVQLSQILYKLYKQIQGFPRVGEGATSNSINNATPITPGHPTRSDSEFMADIIRCIRQLSSIKKIRIFMVQNYTETIVATIIKLLIQEKSKENSRLYKECLRCLQLFSKTATKNFSLHLMQYKDLLQDFVNEFSKNTDIGLGLFETSFQFFSFV